jgi:hypothetical protein
MATHQPALREIRFVIDDGFRGRWRKHRLGDFDANPATTFSDAKHVILTAIQHIRKRLQAALPG